MTGTDGLLQVIFDHMRPTPRINEIGADFHFCETTLVKTASGLIR